MRNSEEGLGRPRYRRGAARGGGVPCCPPEFLNVSCQCL